MSTKHFFVLLNSGQTGVERGAYLAVRTFGIEVTGFMRALARDELGPVPDALASKLVRCDEAGPRRARHANILSACGVIVAVPDARRAVTFTGMKQVIQSVRQQKIPLFVCDPQNDLAELAHQVLESCDGERSFT